VVLHVGTTRTSPLQLAQRDYAVTAISSATGNPGGFSGHRRAGHRSGMPGTLAGSKVIDSGTGVFYGQRRWPAGRHNTNPPATSKRR
jgi:hypothetical protein